MMKITFLLRLLRWLSGEESTCQCRRCRFDPWVRKITWRKEWQPTPVFLPGKLHGQKNPVGYSPWDHKGVGHNLVTKEQWHFYFLHHKSSPRFLPSLLHTAHEKLMAKRQAVEKSEGKNLSHPQTGGLDIKQLKFASKYTARTMVRDELSQLASAKDGAVSVTGGSLGQGADVLDAGICGSCLADLPSQVFCPHQGFCLWRGKELCASYKVLRDLWATVWWSSKVKGVISK